MAARKPAPATIDAYVAGFPADVQSILQRIRRTIRDAAPDARETISYAIPAFALDGALVYFAAFKHHVGFYPPVRGNASLEKAVARYAGEKGNLRFPLDEPIPYALIARIVRHRARQNRTAARARKRR
jgi:uncharacterized protein YdhG (YjbR/CyaY superfamily)